METKARFTPPDTKHNALHINIIQTTNPIIRRCDARTLPHVRPLFRVRRCVCAEYIRTPRRRRRKSSPKTLSLPAEAGNRRVCRKRLRDKADTRTYRADAGYSEAVVRPVPGPRAPRRRGRKPEIGLQICKNGGNFLFLGFEKINPATPIFIMKRTFLLTGRHFGGTLRRGAMAARRRPHQNRLGRESRPAERPARIPAPAIGPRRVAEPQWPVELRDPPAGRNARRIRRRDSRAVRRGVGALGRGPVPRRRERPLVRTDLLRSGEMARQTGAAALRRPRTGRPTSG